jgi:hypothetical protein
MARDKGKRGQPAARSPKADNASWAPGRKGQGGEGYSKGYGGSRGSGTGSAGPESRAGRSRSKAPAPKKTKARR